MVLCYEHKHLYSVVTCERKGYRFVHFLLALVGFRELNDVRVVQNLFESKIYDTQNYT